MDFDSLSREEQLGILAQKPLLPLGPGREEEENHRLKNYLKFFWNISFPDKCHPECAKKSVPCTPPFKVFSDAFYARYPLIVLKGARGTGKALGHSSKLLTPTGWTTMGEIKVGDQVIDMDGKPVNVTGVFPQGLKQMVRVKFGDHTYVDCCEDHLWTVQRDFHTDKWQVKATKDLVGNLRRKNNASNWQIPIVKPIEFPEVDLPIHPYLLGVLLGDGCLVGSTPNISAHPNDYETIENIIPCLPEGMEVKYNAPFQYRLVGHYREGSVFRNFLTDKLKELGLHGLKCDTKFVPKQYLFSSIDQRLELLRGLFDTDGTAVKSESRGASFVSTSKHLTEAVRFIVQSLGGVAYTGIRDKSKEKETYLPQYQTRIKLDFNPFKLKRKAEAYQPPKCNPIKRNIRSIEYLEKYEQASCITVDSQTQTYLTDNLVVTHNSVLVGALALTEQINLNAEVLILGGSQTQSRKVFEYISQVNTRTQGMFWTSVNAPKALQDRKAELMESSRIVTGGLIKCLPASPTSVYGQRPSRLRIDEADVCDLELIDGAIPCAHPIGFVKENILISSTHYASGGTLSAFIDRANAANKVAGKVVTPVYEFCYKDVLAENGGYLTVDQMERMKSMVSPEVWRRQFENGEPAAENTVFNLNDIEWMMDPDLGVYEGAPGQEVIMDPDKFPSKEIDSFYTGADWGVKIDWTVFSVFGSNSDPEGVDYLCYWHRPERESGLKKMVEKYDEILSNFPGPAAHDATGMSQIVSEIVQNNSYPINFSNKKLLENLMNKFISCVQQRKIKMPRIKFLEQELKYLTYEQAYGAKHLPDSVASILMAWYARDRIMRNFNIESYRW